MKSKLNFTIVNKHSNLAKPIEPTRKELRRLAPEQHAVKLTLAIFYGAIKQGEWIDEADLFLYA